MIRSVDIISHQGYTERFVQKKRKICPDLIPDVIIQILQYLNLGHKESVGICLINKEWFTCVLSLSCFRAVIHGLKNRIDVPLNSAMWSLLSNKQIYLISKYQDDSFEDIVPFLLSNPTAKLEVVQQLFYQTGSLLLSQISGDEKLSENVLWLKQELNDLSRLANDLDGFGDINVDKLLQKPRLLKKLRFATYVKTWNSSKPCSRWGIKKSLIINSPSNAIRSLFCMPIYYSFYGDNIEYTDRSYDEFFRGHLDSFEKLPPKFRNDRAVVLTAVHLKSERLKDEASKFSQ